jgi:hypothetical protein
MSVVTDKRIRRDLDVRAADRRVREQYEAEVAAAGRTPTCRCLEGPLADLRNADPNFAARCVRCGRRLP